MAIDPTLVISIGGIGARIACRVEEAATRNLSDDDGRMVRFAAMDTDVADLDWVHRKDDRILTVQTSTRMTIQDYLCLNPSAAEWFPEHLFLKSVMPMQGACMVPAVSRLLFEECLNRGGLDALHDAMRELVGTDLPERQDAQNLHIIIIGTICGGTGAGLTLPLAMHLRRYLAEWLRNVNVATIGCFILPSVLYTAFGHYDPREFAVMNQNAHAALCGLNVFLREGTKIPVGDYCKTDSPLALGQVGVCETCGGIPPYDRCVLLDLANVSASTEPSFDEWMDRAARSIWRKVLNPDSLDEGETAWVFTPSAERAEG